MNLSDLAIHLWFLAIEFATQHPVLTIVGLIFLVSLVLGLLFSGSSSSSSAASYTSAISSTGWEARRQMDRTSDEHLRKVRDLTRR